MEERLRQSIYAISSGEFFFREIPVRTGGLNNAPGTITLQSDRTPGTMMDSAPVTRQAVAVAIADARHTGQTINLVNQAINRLASFRLRLKQTFRLLLTVCQRSHRVQSQ